MNTAKKAVGRPRGRTVPPRPVLSLRIDAEDSAALRASAKAQGRSISQEVILRLRHSLETVEAVRETLTFIAVAKP